MSERVSSLLEETQNNPDWRERRLAIVDLSYQKDEAVVPGLMNKLNDPVSEVRHAAILALARLGVEDAIPELLKPKLLAAPETQVRWAVAAALGKLGDHRIMDSLIRMAEDEEWLVRNEALTGLKQQVKVIIETGDGKLSRILVRMLGVDDPEIVEMAVEGLRNLGGACVPVLVESLGSVSRAARRNTARTLGLIGDGRAVERLTEVLSSDPAPEVRAEAATALGHIGEISALRPLIVAMGDRDEEARKRAADAVVRYGPTATEPVMVALEHGKSKQEKVAAISALGAIGDPRAVPILIDHLRSSYYLVRMATVSALSQYGARVVEPLVEVLSFNRSDISALCEEAESSDDGPTRLRAVRALGGLEDHRAVPVLKSMLSSPESELGMEAQESLIKIGCAAWQRCGALTVLGRVGDERIVPQVLDLLRDDSVHVRQQAVETLGELKSDQAVGPLIELARTDLDPEVRRAALGVARELATGLPELFDIALSRVADPSYGVRATAVRILGDFRDERAIGPLLESLSDPSWNVRFSAENALYTLGEKVVPGLIDVLRKGELVARNRALSALGRIGDSRAIEPIEELIGREENRATVAMAKEVLKRLRGETTRAGSL
jgi:HEAT repeat protein